MPLTMVAHVTIPTFIRGLIVLLIFSGSDTDDGSFPSDKKVPVSHSSSLTILSLSYFALLSQRLLKLKQNTNGRWECPKYATC